MRNAAGFIAGHWVDPVEATPPVTAWSAPGFTIVRVDVRRVAVATVTQAGAFSVVCSFSEPPSEHGSPGEARVRFLADDAPRERLAAGSRFQLFEGPGEVASVEILW